MLRSFWSESCQVVEACNGQEAMEVAYRAQPDLILMDGSLRLLDGLDTTRRIHENDALREVLILALNALHAKGRSFLATRSKTAGAEYFREMIRLQSRRTQRIGIRLS